MCPFSTPKNRRERLLQELTRIDIHTRRVARQALLGEYQSSLLGSGFEFEEHRKYAQGDDYRRIDWNVVARTADLQIKVCHEEKEMTALIVADLSRSMEFGAGRFSKLDVLIEAVATIAFSAASANMAVGIVAGAHDVDLEIEPRKGRRQVWHILDQLLEYQPPVGPTQLEILFRRSLQLLKHPSMFFVVSDFIVAHEALHSASLSRIASLHDLIPVVIEDRLEEQLPAVGGYIRLRDSESSQTVRLTLSNSNCRVFSSHMKERQIALRRAFLRLGVVPVRLKTGRSPLHPLMEFFLQRKKGR